MIYIIDYYILCLCFLASQAQGLWHIPSDISIVFRVLAQIGSNHTSQSSRLLWPQIIYMTNGCVMFQFLFGSKSKNHAIDRDGFMRYVDSWKWWLTSPSKFCMKQLLQFAQHWCRSCSLLWMLKIALSRVMDQLKGQRIELCQGPTVRILKSNGTNCAKLHPELTSLWLSIGTPRHRQLTDSFQLLLAELGQIGFHQQLRPEGFQVYGFGCFLLAWAAWVNIFSRANSYWKTFGNGMKINEMDLCLHCMVTRNQPGMFLTAQWALSSHVLELQFAMDPLKTFLAPKAGDRIEVNQNHPKNGFHQVHESFIGIENPRVVNW